MSELHAHLTDALREHQIGCGLCTLAASPAHTRDMLLSLPGIAIVEVPQLTKEQLRQQYWITFDAAGIYWLNEPTLATPEQTREFAVALLAAADAAEAT